jgi:hypothetical protein
MKSGRGFFNHAEDAPERSREAPPLPEEASRTAVVRLKAALDSAVEILGAGTSCSREDILEGLKEYFGD